MPRLTVRAMAEMLSLPAYQQVRILHDQKYPRQEPQVFRMPYYAPALNAIRKYYGANNNRAVMAAAKIGVSNIGLPTRRENNARVLEKFEKSSQFSRKLAMRPNPSVSHNVGGIELKLSCDLRAYDGNREKIIYYNCRTTALDSEVTKLTLEIAQWIMEESGFDLAASTFEYIDFRTGKVHIGVKRRPSTIKTVKNNIKIIETLWPTI